jgi:hypothetical protein
MKRALQCSAAASLLSLGVSVQAQEAAAGDAAAGGPSEMGLGLAPGAPQVSNVAGGMTPAYGSQSQNLADWRFDLHGLLLLPLRVGINSRDTAYQDQKKTVLHTPPVVPGAFETFEYTAVAPDPWVQLNFSYGNPVVVATVIIAARTVANADSWFNAPDHVGINDAFFTYRPQIANNVKVNVNLGGFAQQYGHMGEYDSGRYGTPLIARVGGMGVTGTGLFLLENDLDLLVEAGIQGQLTKTPIGIEPAAWNGYADPNVGTTFAPHAHLALSYKGIAQLGAHYISAFAQDDRATPTFQPDGNISVVGVDARLTAGRFGHLYLGYAHTSADSARSVSSVIRVLNAPGGPGLMDEYFGRQSDGTGSLDTFGFEYDFSLANYLAFPRKFAGKSPDIVGSVFGIFTSVDSPLVPLNDGVQKLKYGVELGYSALSWFGFGGRYDRVLNDTDDARQTHAILTARAIFRSDFNARDQITLQYSRYLTGSGVGVMYGSPPQRDYVIDPDENVLSLMASMWW